MTSKLPPLIYEMLTAWFGFPEKTIHAQVATASANRPHLRTMLLFEITSNGELVFLTHKETQKWQDLQSSPYIATTLVNLNYGQITVEGVASLKSKNDTDLSRYWESLPLYVRRIYTSSPGTEIPETLGVIIVSPGSWEILVLNNEDYNLSVRKQFFQKNGTWNSLDLKPL